MISLINELKIIRAYALDGAFECGVPKERVTVPSNHIEEALQELERWRELEEKVLPLLDSIDVWMKDIPLQEEHINHVPGLVYTLTALICGHLHHCATIQKK